MSDLESIYNEMFQTNLKLIDENIKKMDEIFNIICSDKLNRKIPEHVFVRDISCVNLVAIEVIDCKKVIRPNIWNNAKVDIEFNFKCVIKPNEFVNCVRNSLFLKVCHSFDYNDVKKYNEVREIRGSNLIMVKLNKLSEDHIEMELNEMEPYNYIDNCYLHIDGNMFIQAMKNIE